MTSAGEQSGEENSIEEDEEDPTNQDVVLQRNTLEIQAAACGDRPLAFAFPGAALHPTAPF
jgi:hypothetical protein